MRTKIPCKIGMDRAVLINISSLSQNASRVYLTRHQSKHYIKKGEFTWNDPATGIKELDDLTMLQIIVQGINLTTRVGVSNYSIEIQSDTLPKHNNNAQDMLDYMEANYEEILCHNFTHPDYVMHLFNTLRTSKNDILRSMIQREKDKWELGEDVQPDSLV